MMVKSALGSSYELRDARVRFSQDPCEDDSTGLYLIEAELRAHDGSSQPFGVEPDDHRLTAKFALMRMDKGIVWQRSDSFGYYLLKCKDETVSMDMGGKMIGKGFSEKILYPSRPILHWISRAAQKTGFVCSMNHLVRDVSNNSLLDMILTHEQQTRALELLQHQVDVARARLTTEVETQPLIDYLKSCREAGQQ